MSKDRAKAIIKSELLLHFGSLNNTYLAGSFCFGTPDCYSDIDVLIVGDKEGSEVIATKIGTFDIKYIKENNLGRFKYRSNVYNLSVLHLATNTLIPGDPEHERYIILQKRSANLRHLSKKNTLL